MTTYEAISRIKAALAKRPTPGNWIHWTRPRALLYGSPGWTRVYQKIHNEAGDLVVDDSTEGPAFEDNNANWAYVAACNPEAIAALIQSHLALLEALNQMLHFSYHNGMPYEHEARVAARAAILNATQSTKESTK